MASKIKFIEEIFAKSAAFVSANCGDLIGIFLVYYVPMALTEFFLWDNPSYIQTLLLKYDAPVYEVFEILLKFLFQVYGVVFLITILNYVTFKNYEKHITIKDAYLRSFKQLDKMVMLNLTLVLKVLMWGVLFIVPGIIKMFHYFLGNISYIVDEREGDRALAFSEELGRKHWKRLFICVFGLLAIVQVLGYPVIAYTDYLTSNALEADKIVLAHIFQYLQNFLIASATVYCLVYYYFLYEQIKKW